MRTWGPSVVFLLAHWLRLSSFMCMVTYSQLYVCMLSFRCIMREAETTLFRTRVYQWCPKLLVYPPLLGGKFIPSQHPHTWAVILELQDKQQILRVKCWHGILARQVEALFQSLTCTQVKPLQLLLFLITQFQQTPPVLLLGHFKLHRTHHLMVLCRIQGLLLHQPLDLCTTVHKLHLLTIL